MFLIFPERIYCWEESPRVLSRGRHESFFYENEQFKKAFICESFFSTLNHFVYEIFVFANLKNKCKGM